MTTVSGGTSACGRRSAGRRLCRAAQGRRQSGAKTLVTAEPDACIAHVRVWGGRLGNRWLYPEADCLQRPAPASLPLSAAPDT